MGYSSHPVAPRSGVPSPTPDPPPSPPSPPSPSPSGVTWHCYDDHYSRLAGDTDLKYVGHDKNACEARCAQTQGCRAINWHKHDDHCHVKVGSFTKFMYHNSLVKSHHWDSCYASTAGDAGVVV